MPTHNSEEDIKTMEAQVRVDNLVRSMNKDTAHRTQFLADLVMITDVVLPFHPSEFILDSMLVDGDCTPCEPEIQRLPYPRGVVFGHVDLTKYIIRWDEYGYGTILSE